MIMDDHEILMMYKQAADPKAQIEILADLNQCSIWEMREHLISLGAHVDGRWYQNLNPARKKPETERFSLQPAAQTDDCDERIRRLEKELDESIEANNLLEQNLKIKDEQIADLEQALSEKDRHIEQLTAELEALRTARPVTAVNEAVVLTAFLRGSYGLDAYRLGVLLDAIWQARFAGADPRDVAEEIYNSMKEDHDAA